MTCPGCAFDPHEDLAFCPKCGRLEAEDPGPVRRREVPDVGLGLNDWRTVKRKAIEIHPARTWAAGGFGVIVLSCHLSDRS
jgi:hypothetical protein